MSGDPVLEPPSTAVADGASWKRRHDKLETRAFSAHHRELAANGREEGARARA